MAGISKITLKQNHSIYRLGKKIRAKLEIEGDNDALADYILIISVRLINGPYPKAPQPPVQSS